MAEKNVPGDRPAGVSAEASGGAAAVRSALRRFFTSNDARLKLSEDVVRRLDSIKTRGIALLDYLEPYQCAFSFALPEVPPEAVSLIRRDLDRAQQEFYLSGKFREFPKSDAALEVTSALSAFFFVGAAARYCPELILQTPMEDAARRQMAEKFLNFFERHLARFTDPNIKGLESAQGFHEQCYEAYLEFRKEMPELVQMLRNKLRSSRAQLMSPYGTGEFLSSWWVSIYNGSL